MKRDFWAEWACAWARAFFFPWLWPYMYRKREDTTLARTSEYEWSSNGNVGLRDT